MEQLEVDVAVIGWGKAGKSLARTLALQGRRVAMIEQSEAMIGGSCVNIACVPTKALVHDAGRRPVQADPIDWFASSVSRRDALTARMRSRNRELLDEVDSVLVIGGRARFTGPLQLEVAAGVERLSVRAETVVVNTGSLPAVPPIPGAALSHVHDSTTLQHAGLPERLVIVGAGYVGLEFAGMFAGFGSQVTVVGRSQRFLPGQDVDVAEAVRAVLEAAGVDFHLGEQAVEITDEAVRLAGGSRLSADAVLLATGRRPATDGLDLAAGGVTTDERGWIVVDDRLRTSAPGVFAVGDVNGGPQFTYASYDDYRIVADQLLGAGERRTSDRRAVPSTTFLTPPLAQVGLTESQARDQGLRVRIAAKPVAEIAAMPRPKIVGQTAGLIKFVIDADSDLIVGATLFCVDAQEVINLIALAMRSGVTASELRDGIWTHPSTTEALNEVLAFLDSPS